MKYFQQKRHLLMLLCCKHSTHILVETFMMIACKLLCNDKGDEKTDCYLYKLREHKRIAACYNYNINIFDYYAISFSEAYSVSGRRLCSV